MNNVLFLENLENRNLLYGFDTVFEEIKIDNMTAGEKLWYFSRHLTYLVSDIAAGAGVAIVMNEILSGNHDIQEKLSLPANRMSCLMIISGIEAARMVIRYIGDSPLLSIYDSSAFWSIWGTIFTLVIQEANNEINMEKAFSTKIE